MSHPFRNISETFINQKKALGPKTERLSFSPDPELNILYENIEISLQALLLILVSFFMLYLVHTCISYRSQSTNINRGADDENNSYQAEQSV